jgi:hypothetical protein
MDARRSHYVSPLALEFAIVKRATHDAIPASGVYIVQTEMSGPNDTCLWVELDCNCNFQRSADAGHTDSTVSVD